MNHRPDSRTPPSPPPHIYHPPISPYLPSVPSIQLIESFVGFKPYPSLHIPYPHCFYIIIITLFIFLIFILL
jgi:hypothetical protein